MAIGIRRISGREEIRNGITGTSGGPPSIDSGSSSSGGPPARAKTFFGMGVLTGGGGSALATIFAGQNGGAGGSSFLPGRPASIDCGTSVSGGPPSGPRLGVIIGSGGSALAITIFAGQTGGGGGTSSLPAESPDSPEVPTEGEEPFHGDPAPGDLLFFSASAAA